MSFDHHRQAHESEVEWGLRKRFLEAHCDKYDDQNRLLCMASCFINVELYGCDYRQEVMIELKERMSEIYDDVQSFRKSVRDRSAVKFVKAKDGTAVAAKTGKNIGDFSLSSGKSHSPDSKITEKTPLNTDFLKDFISEGSKQILLKGEIDADYHSVSNQNYSHRYTNCDMQTKSFKPDNSFVSSSSWSHACNHHITFHDTQDERIKLDEFSMKREDLLSHKTNNICEQSGECFSEKVYESMDTFSNGEASKSTGDEQKSKKKGSLCATTLVNPSVSSSISPVTQHCSPEITYHDNYDIEHPTEAIINIKSNSEVKSLSDMNKDLTSTQVQSWENSLLKAMLLQENKTGVEWKFKSVIRRPRKLYFICSLFLHSVEISSSNASNTKAAAMSEANDYANRLFLIDSKRILGISYRLEKNDRKRETRKRKELNKIIKSFPYTAQGIKEESVNLQPVEEIKGKNDMLTLSETNRDSAKYLLEMAFLQQIKANVAFHFIEVKKSIGVSHFVCCFFLNSVEIARSPVCETKNDARYIAIQKAECFIVDQYKQLLGISLTPSKYAIFAMKVESINRVQHKKRQEMKERLRRESERRKHKQQKEYIPKTKYTQCIASGKERIKCDPFIDLNTPQDTKNVENWFRDFYILEKVTKSQLHALEAIASRNKGHLTWVKKIEGDNAHHTVYLNDVFLGEGKGCDETSAKEAAAAMALTKLRQHCWTVFQKKTSNSNLVFSKEDLLGQNGIVINPKTVCNSEPFQDDEKSKEKTNITVPKNEVCHYPGTKCKVKSCKNKKSVFCLHRRLEEAIIKYVESQHPDDLVFDWFSKEDKDVVVRVAKSYGLRVRYPRSQKMQLNAKCSHKELLRKVIAHGSETEMYVAIPPTREENKENTSQ